MLRQVTLPAINLIVSMKFVFLINIYFFFSLNEETLIYTLWFIIIAFGNYITYIPLKEEILMHLVRSENEEKNIYLINLWIN